MADIREKVYFSAEFKRSISKAARGVQVRVSFHLVPKCAFGHAAECRSGLKRDFTFAESGRAFIELGR